MDQVLFVDDEENILNSIKRTFYNKIPLTIVNSPLSALALIEKNQFAVIVSDMRMPEMNGVDFFKKVREISPDSIRIMLTGNADNKTTIDAINQGNIFRFLTKPCTPQDLLKAVLEGIQQYQLKNIENELLENTLNGSIGVLSDLISMSNPFLFSLTREITQIYEYILVQNDIEFNWQYRITANFTLLGLMSVDVEKLMKLISGISFHDEELFYEPYFALAGEILTSIPRLDDVVLILTSLRYNRFELELLDKSIKIPTAILRIAIDYVFFSTKGFSREEIVEKFMTKETYIHKYISCLLNIDHNINVENLAELSINKIKTGMIIQNDIKSAKGLLLIPKNTVVNNTIIKLLKAFAKKESQISEILVKY